MQGGALRCGDGGQLSKAGGRQQGASTGATEWDPRGIGSSKDGKRDWGRNVVSNGNALALISIGIGVGISSRSATHDVHKVAVQGRSSTSQGRNKPAPWERDDTCRGSFAGSCLPSLRLGTVAPH